MKCRIVAQAIYDYTARTPEELSFITGDILLISNDSDIDWWDSWKRKPVQDSSTFEDTQDDVGGLVPSTYVEEMAPLFLANVLYDYSPSYPATANGNGGDEEMEIRDGDSIKVYQEVDENWWFAKRDDEVGLVPSNYIEKIANSPSNITSLPLITNPDIKQNPDDAQTQKLKLLNALEGFGFAKSVSKSSLNRVQGAEMYGPEDIKYFNVIDMADKKKIKGLLGICTDSNYLYFLDMETKEVNSKTSISEISKIRVNRKTRLIVESGGTLIEYEGEKSEISEIFEAITKAQSTSAQIVIVKFGIIVGCCRRDK